MTQPPTWGAPPPQQPGGWPGQPGPSGQWGPPQQPWPAPVPPKKGGAAKWAIGAVSLVAVIAVTAVVAVSCTKSSGGNNSSGGGGSSTSVAPPDVASANDKGPVGIITEDPSCAPWGPINNTLADVENKGWQTRDPSIPASSWTPDVKSQYEAVGNAMQNAADQAVPLAKMTPHRVMRELYGQFTVYARAYAASVSRYTPIDNNLAFTAGTTSLVIGYVCRAISSGAAAARASLVPAQTQPASTAPVGDLSSPQRIFASPDPICADLSPTLDSLLQNPTFKSWTNGDPSISASNWPPEQRSLTDAVAPVMTSTADSLEALTHKSSNPIIWDFIQLGVQYRRTFIASLSTYQASDQNIYLAGQYAPGIVSMACNYAAG